ncbi:MAG TPA: NTP transferase domain-containing protein [Roseiflexaceae bacterium]|nr:NTP transferase domain-containing protein [Roseiflexaceae bacterium]
MRRGVRPNAPTLRFGDMNQRRLGIVVIAAGKGTRMRSGLPKELHALCGRSMLGHVLALAEALEPVYTVVVLSPEKLGPVRASADEARPYTYAVQAEQLGTGHAVLQARSALPSASDEVLVLYGDTPLLRAETARAVVDLRRANAALVSILSMHVPPPSGYGRIVRDDAGRVVAIVEERNATQEQFALTECNSGVMCFDAAWLWQALARIPPNPVNGEYYLTELADMAVAERGPGAAVALPADDAREAWGINDRAQLAQAETVMRERILDRLMRAGVSITDPANTYVDVDVTVGGDSTLLPGTYLRGATDVGPNCEIGPATMIVDSSIGSRARVRYALVERAAIAPGAAIGPFEHISGDEKRRQRDE